MIEYDEQLSKETERGYLMPEIVNQRSRTMEALQLRAGEHVLDVGCGMGLLARDLALAVGENGRILGIDNSPSMIRLAKKRCVDFPQIELKEASVTQLSEPDNSFDVITCAQLLLYLPNVVQAIAEMHRVLKKGGRIAIVETDWRGVVFNTMDEALTRSLFEAWEASVPSPHLPGQL
ncbi:MAG: methyltransferase domain-containing protein, partial [Chloroflexota bacterium]